MIPLKGDGSDRKWYRLSAENADLIMVDHGIRSGGDTTCEVDAFVAIGRHLYAKGAAVPRIHLHDEFAGLVFMEDLGNLHLQDAVRGRNPREITGIYRHVIDRWLHMALEGSRDFNPAWTYQTTHYNRRVILDNECRYFAEAFVQAYLNLPLDYEALVEDFETLADLALADPVIGFMHRDLQSRNIMVKDEKAHFIDFQGGRLGPLQYDLASLLIDPYAALPPDLQDQLSAYAAAALAQRSSHTDRALFQGYDYCAICRNLQMLGAFAFLSRTKLKKQFETHIPRAVQTLRQRLTDRVDKPLPKLRQVVDTIADTLGIN
jgi:aminoglycoside/choline kinase family phosphotransferase